MHLPTQIELRRVEQLLPCARNSRVHSDEQIAQVAASIREFGWTNPVLVGAAFTTLFLIGWILRPTGAHGAPLSSSLSSLGFAVLAGA